MGGMDGWMDSMAKCTYLGRSGEGNKWPPTTITSNISQQFPTTRDACLAFQFLLSSLHFQWLGQQSNQGLLICSRKEPTQLLWLEWRRKERVFSWIGLDWIQERKKDQRKKGRGPCLVCLSLSGFSLPSLSSPLIQPNPLLCSALLPNQSQYLTILYWTPCCLLTPRIFQFFFFLVHPQPSLSSSSSTLCLLACPFCCCCCTLGGGLLIPPYQPLVSLPVLPLSCVLALLHTR